MILCLDAGNTRLKWGVFDESACLRANGVASYDRLDTLEFPFPVEGAILSNVAGVEVGERLRDRLFVLGIPLHQAQSSASQCGVTNRYEIPGQLGADRWAALIGARARHKGACLVVMAGTATTVDWLDEGGEFLGGLILPGVDLMRSSLTQNTARLGAEPGRFQRLPGNTADAIMSGCLQAQVGAIERQYRSLSPQEGASCLLAGGAAAWLEPFLAIPFRRVDNLVLEGLFFIGRESCPDGLT